MVKIPIINIIKNKKPPHQLRCEGGKIDETENQLLYLFFE